MSKFTFFTILFSLTVIVIVGQLVLRDALFPEEYQTDIVSQGELPAAETKSPETDFKDVSPYISDEEIPVLTDEDFASDVVVDQPDESLFSSISESSSSAPAVPASQNILDIRLLQQVGFSQISNKIFLGKVFDLFDISKQILASLASFEVKEKGRVVGTFIELELPDEISAQELYKLIQNKSKVYIDLAVNETNQYGDRSFYINHRKKVDEAFLVLRMKNRLYTFAYLKDFHPRVKTLISFLYTAILDRR